MLPQGAVALYIPTLSVHKDSSFFTHPERELSLHCQRKLQISAASMENSMSLLKKKKTIKRSMPRSIMPHSKK